MRKINTHPSSCAVRDGCAKTEPSGRRFKLNASRSRGFLNMMSPGITWNWEVTRLNGSQVWEWPRMSVAVAL